MILPCRFCGVQGPRTALTWSLEELTPKANNPFPALQGRVPCPKLNSPVLESFRHQGNKRKERFPMILGGS